MCALRELVCQLEDEGQYLRDAHEDALRHSCQEALLSCDTSSYMRCRVEVSDPDDPRKIKLVSLEELLGTQSAALERDDRAESRADRPPQREDSRSEARVLYRQLFAQ